MTYESKYAVGDVVSYWEGPRSVSNPSYYAKVLAVKFDENKVCYAMSDSHQMRGPEGYDTKWIDEKYVIQKFEAVK